MKKNLLILLPVFLFWVSSSPGQITFQKTFGGSGNESGNSIQQTADDGYILTGYTTSFGSGSFDVYVVKTDAEGNIIWTKTFGGTGYDRGEDVKQTSDGGYIIVGSLTDFGSGLTDIYLLKLDINGDTLWTKTYGDTGNDFGQAIQQTDDGGFVIAGISSDSINNFQRACIIKTDANGVILWTKIFIGSFYHCTSNSIQQISDGGYIVTGISPGGHALLFRMDSSGDTLWTKVFWATYYQSGWDVRQTNDGGFILAGSFDTSAVSQDVYLIKTNANGDTLWTRTFGGADMENGLSVFQTTDNGYIIAGYTFSFGGGIQKTYLIKTDSSGNALWTKTYGGAVNQNATSVIQTNDGGYILTGQTGSFGMGSSDVYLVKTDSNGNSGCNEAIPATVTFIPAITVSNFSATISSAVFVTESATIVSSGGSSVTLCITDISEVHNLQSEFLLSPNPFSSTLTLHFPKPQNLKAQLIVFNSIGEAVVEKEIRMEEQMLNLSTLPQGIYLVRLRTTEGIFTEKIVK